MATYRKTVSYTGYFEIDREVLTDVLSLLVSGSIEYWGALKVYDDSEYTAARDNLIKDGKRREDICYEDVLAEMLIEGSSSGIGIYDREEHARHYINLQMLEEAITEACQQCGTDLCDWDGETGDLIAQQMCFGEIIYG